jgi:hypothetical protein
MRKPLTCPICIIRFARGWDQLREMFDCGNTAGRERGHQYAHTSQGPRSLCALLPRADRPHYCDGRRLRQIL